MIDIDAFNTILATVSASIGAVSSWLISTRRHNVKAREVVDGFIASQFARLDTRILNLETANMSLNQANIALSIQVGVLKEEIAKLTSTIKEDTLKLEAAAVEAEKLLQKARVEAEKLLETTKMELLKMHTN